MNSTIAAQNPVLANVYSTSNIYNYDLRDLWIAYGIAASSALFCAIVGIYAIWRNGATYQNVFSTFLRTTRDQALQNLIDPSDNGAEPLPKDLARVNITLAKDLNITLAEDLSIALAEDPNITSAEGQYLTMQQVSQRRPSSEADASSSSSVSREIEEGAETAHAGQEEYSV